MGICPQQFRTAIGLYTNPGYPKNPKGIRHYHRFKSFTHYHPGEHSLVVFLILSICSALLSCILADVVLSLSNIVFTALASGDCPPKWKADFLVSSTQHLHETRGSLNECLHAFSATVTCPLSIRQTKGVGYDSGLVIFIVK